MKLFRKKNIYKLAWEAFKVLFGIYLGYSMAKRLYSAQLKKQSERTEKFTKYFDVFHYWLKIKEQDSSISAILQEAGYNQIAIYGMGVVGNHLYKELNNSEVKVSYVIDRNADNIYNNEGYEVRNLDQKLEAVDAIIVTAVFEFEKIKYDIEKISKYPVLSLLDILEAWCVAKEVEGN